MQRSATKPQKINMEFVLIFLLGIGIGVASGWLLRNTCEASVRGDFLKFLKEVKANQIDVNAVDIEKLEKVATDSIHPTKPPIRP